MPNEVSRESHCMMNPFLKRSKDLPKPYIKSQTDLLGFGMLIYKPS